MGTKWNLCALLGRQVGAATLENSVKFFKKLKKHYYVIQKFHFW